MRKLVGSAQKPGRYPYIPIAARQNIDIASAVLSSRATLSTSPTDVRSIDRAVCQRRSPVRSGPANHQDSTRPTQYGMAAMSVTIMFERPERFFMIDGSQNWNP